MKQNTYNLVLIRGIESLSIILYIIHDIHYYLTCILHVYTCIICLVCPIHTRVITIVVYRELWSAYVDKLYQMYSLAYASWNNASINANNAISWPIKR